MQATVLNRVAQGLRQDFLTGHVIEFLRTPLAGDYLIGHNFEFELVRGLDRAHERGLGKSLD